MGLSAPPKRSKYWNTPRSIIILAVSQSEKQCRHTICSNGRRCRCWAECMDGFQITAVLDLILGFLCSKAQWSMQSENVQHLRPYLQLHKIGHGLSRMEYNHKLFPVFHPDSRYLHVGCTNYGIHVLGHRCNADAHAWMYVSRYMTLSSRAGTYVIWVMRWFPSLHKATLKTRVPRETTDMVGSTRIRLTILLGSINEAPTRFATARIQVPAWLVVAFIVT